MIATYQVWSNIKLVNTKVTNILTRFVLLSQIILININTYYAKPKNAFFSLINKEWLKFIEKKKYFYCWELGHTIANSLKCITKTGNIIVIAGIAINNTKKPVIK